MQKFKKENKINQAVKNQINTLATTVNQRETSTLLNTGWLESGYGM